MKKPSTVVGGFVLWKSEKVVDKINNFCYTDYYISNIIKIQRR